MRIDPMPKVKFVYWQEEGAWLGYLPDYPDYWTQGETLDDLKEHLTDLYQDLISGSAGHSDQRS
jgi:predicted RNase H-like HicB family nuclease